MESLTIQEESKNTNKQECSNEEIVEVKEAVRPFSVIRNGEKWYVALGMHRLTNELGSEEEAQEDAKRTDWERVMQVTYIVSQQALKDYEDTKLTKKQ